MRKAAKRDINEKAIIGHLRAIGCYVQPINQEGTFDLLVGYRRKWHIIEVKNPDKLAKKKRIDGKLIERTDLQQREDMLTKDEKVFYDAVTVAGLPYHIVFSTEEAQAVVCETHTK